ncbi:MAG: phosphatase PAP2 family protein [Candidatus Tectomicrobia bacterium]|nr:phosphatase PAP2 family protein [Candidatus Tectomicrobia bacterium]
MLSSLASLDLELFRAANAIDWPGWAAAILSALARSNLWVAPLALAFLVLAVLGGRRERTYVLAALLALAATEVLGSGILKPLIARPRPCHVLEGVRLVGGCTKSFAMPSGHAANSFAQAAVLGLFYRPTVVLSAPFAALVALSRVTDGKHYPSDVLVGALLGLVVALVVVRALRPGLEDALGRLSRWFPPAERLLEWETAETDRPALAFWVVLGVATALRLWYVGWADLAPEEAVQWDRARLFRGWGWLAATPAEALARGGTELLGDTELGVRAGALAVSLGTSVVVFLWAGKAFPWSRWAGPLAGAGLLAAPVFGMGGAQLTGVTLSLLFWTGALAAADLAASGAEENASWLWGLWGLCVGLAIRTEPSAALLVPVSGLSLALLPEGRRWLRRRAPYLGLALALAVTAVPWAEGALPRARPLGGVETAGAAAFLKWYLVHGGPFLLLFILWGVVWALCAALREKRTEYFPLLGFSLLCVGLFGAWAWRGGARPEWAAGALIPAWMAAVGAATEILRRGDRRSVFLFKVLALVLTLGILQTTLLLNVRLLRKLDVKTLPETDPAASVIGWRPLGERVGRSLEEMGEGTLLLAGDPGTAAELAFYAPFDRRSGRRPKVRVVPAGGAPPALLDSLAGRGALLVMPGEWGEPPGTVRPLFRSWRREDLFRVERRKGGTVRSVTLFRLHGFTGPPAGGTLGPESAP